MIIFKQPFQIFITVILHTYFLKSLTIIVISNTNDHMFFKNMCISITIFNLFSKPLKIIDILLYKKKCWLFHTRLILTLKMVLVSFQIIGFNYVSIF